MMFLPFEPPLCETTRHLEVDPFPGTSEMQWSGSI